MKTITYTTSAALASTKAFDASTTSRDDRNDDVLTYVTEDGTREIVCTLDESEYYDGYSQLDTDTLTDSVFDAFLKHLTGEDAFDTTPKPERFVLCVGAVRDAYPDIPESAEFPADGSVVIFDRQEQRPAVTIHPAYAQLIALELTHASGPEALSNWMNALSNLALASEGITITK